MCIVDSSKYKVQVHKGSVGARNIIVSPYHVFYNMIECNCVKKIPNRIKVVMESGPKDVRHLTVGDMTDAHTSSTIP